MGTEAKQARSRKTRQSILNAAQQLFAATGYEQTTVREIAARANADPSLIIRYFGSKEALFAEAVDFDLQLPDFTNVARAELGDAIIRHFLKLWEDETSGVALKILLKTAVVNDEAASKIRRIFEAQVVPAISRISAGTEMRVKGGLISSQLLGFALGRYILKLPPVAALDQEQIRRSMGPVIQQMLTGEPPSLQLDQNGTRND